ncbi:uncharacterized protein Dana_GF23245 [Drosophila ananassae]|uniref:procollagen-proline 4-dioxygenase n=2 Tax=Drosophila ananassae TaxID=7217 RepID=B3MSW2_DROAN|nr:uncharacterized protein Dana_GF23245 [Drosophila ananassae]
MFIIKFFTFIVLLFPVQVWCNEFANTVPDKAYAASTSRLMKLLEVEDELAENLSGYVEKLKRKLSIVEKSLCNLKAKHIQMKMDYETYFGNPLNSFSLIYRLSSSWKMWLKYTSESQKEELEHIDEAHRMRTQLPTSSDLQMASRGIDELMAYYKLTPEELGVGNLSGYTRPETALSSLDCYALGEFCIQIRKDALAEAWFNASLRLFKENNSVYNVYDFSRTTIDTSWGALLIKNNQYDAAFNHFGQSSLSNISREVQNQFEEDLGAKRNCSAKFRLPNHLHCRYNSSTSPFLHIAPLKMEEISTDPYMVVYHDVIYENEINWLLDNSDFRTSLVGESQISTLRTSQDMPFGANSGEVMRNIEKRIKDMTGLSMDLSEDFMLINYGIGGTYKMHYDFYVYSEPLRFLRGERIVTVLFYLGDVELSGSTVFPFLNISITPKKGSAVMWYNLHNSGDVHQKTQHCACPVVVGSKYVLTKWINELHQTFITPCMKDSNIHS